MFKKYKHIHFVGIGGIGMSGIAQVLITLGYHVSGSDVKKSPVTTHLVRCGAKVYIGHNAKNIKGAHVVVVSSAVTSDNEEIVAARRLAIPIVPRAEMLAELMRLKYGIAIAGTHGKTTTTSLVATILAGAGLDPTMIIGGKVNSFKTNARLGKGEYLVAEADESDRSFLKLSPTIAVITNIDPEHMENYRDFEHVKETYVAFANKVPFYGAAVVCGDHAEVKKIIPKIERPVVTYGMTNADYTALNIKQIGTELRFDAFYKGKKLGQLKINMPGRHNVLNALAALAVALELEIPFAKVSAALSGFKGIERRFQILMEEDGRPMVVSDYAHHPKEIEAVFAAVRDGWPDRRIVCVMQPHRFTRLAGLFNEFAEILSKPDILIVMPLYAASETPIAGISSDALVSKVVSVSKNGRPTLYIDDRSKMFDVLNRLSTHKDMILFLGAGDVWKAAGEFVKTVTGILC